MTLQLRRTEDARYGVYGGPWDEWMPLEVDTYELVERIERSIHLGHGGPMFLCRQPNCIDWVTWLRDQGVVF